MSVEDRWDAFIREQILDLARDPRDWIGLVDLRPRLGLRGLRRDAQDHHLERLSLAGKLHLATEDNRKVLRDSDHAAAIYIGGEACHIVMWDGD